MNDYKYCKDCYAFEEEDSTCRLKPPKYNTLYTAWQYPMIYNKEENWCTKFKCI